MLLNNSSERAIYLQLAEEIEDKILKGIYLEESQIPSITEMSVSYRINPATANRAVNILAADGILYKKRGIGMYVTQGAVSKITLKRKESFISDFVSPMINEAENLGIKKADLLGMIDKMKGFK